MTWLYLIAGSLALYMVENADASQPWHITALISLVLCAIPAAIDNFLHPAQLAAWRQLLIKRLLNSGHRAAGRFSD